MLQSRTSKKNDEDEKVQKWRLLAAKNSKSSHQNHLILVNKGSLEDK